MNIFSSIQAFHSAKKTIVTLGTFDGVHLGHQSILKQLVAEAKAQNCESLVLTFFPHPRMVLKQDDSIKLINAIEEKTELLANLGIDNLVIHAFDTVFSQLSGEEFAKQVLVDIFKVQKIIVGYDHRFGKGGACNFDDLVAFGKKYNFEVEQISAQQINTVAVSSTKVREALTSGAIEKANSFLGYPYFLSGKVVMGKQLGRTIGFPTANIKPEVNYKLIPQNGVYLVQVQVLQNQYYGMLNIGNNPTVNGAEQTIEVHLLNFDANIYNQNIKVSFLKRLRDVVKFESIDALKNQLEADKQAAIAYFKL
ncbi:bifunctional riboflavin kinase/FAD synthetase [Flavobacterium agricola]|uniref:Riboflavin biosynthesis protein n=1 Tax=Flavobacterium agricola TaxID=2870839 RepID=A0ABY6LXV9_9FLAO|nr:bifunctional riboflavin kinase/FAD synthetase [Flavobacterium agricola]UYW01175.1 bifunctional riboflavin kinase/FAD synthetase [Flavobacterium agricola]